MNDVKWIKIATGMFDNRKIKHLRRLPEGNDIALIWIMLLTMAGKCNSGGMIFLTEDIPYTPDMLADEMDVDEDTMDRALEVLEKLGMLTVENGFYVVTGWEEHQNTEGLDKIREQNRIRKQKQREKQVNRDEKESCDDNCDSKRDDNCDSHVMSRDNFCDGHTMSRDCHATEEEIEIDKDIEKEKDKKEKEDRTDYSEIVRLYNSLCPSLPSVKSLSASRKKTIRARLNTYSFDDFTTLFRKAEASQFLKGANERNWTATFDWLLKDANMAKVIDGNYDNKISVRTGAPTQKVKKDMNNFDRRNYDMDDLEKKLLGGGGQPERNSRDDPGYT